MSAAAVILPQVWAMFHPVGVDSLPIEPKPPHRLTLVPAKAPPCLAVIQAQIEPELALYRIYTEAMLGRYMKLSFEAARVPSLMGREMFRGDVSHCRVHGFDDVVIFVHDVATCIGKLSPGKQLLIERIALQGFSQSETAAMLGIGLSTVIRRYWEAVDRLTSLLIERKMLEPLLESKATPEMATEGQLVSRGPGFDEGLM
jgi:hypothetical protein